MEKSVISNLVEQLIERGEDKDELMYWLDIYDDLAEDKQKELGEILQQELDVLQKEQ